jgi:hypothetical protein
MPLAPAATDPDLDAKLQTLGDALKLMNSRGQGTDPRLSANFAEDFRTALNATRGGAVKAGEGVSGGISQDDRVSLDAGQWAYPAAKQLGIRTSDEVRASLAKFNTTNFPDPRVKAAAAKRLRNAAKTYQVQIDESQLKLAEPQSFADAPGGAGGVPTNGAFEHIHEHQHEDGTVHDHNHWHYAGTNQHSQGSTVPHEHESEESVDLAAAGNKYEADRAPDPKEMPKPGAVVSSVTAGESAAPSAATSTVNPIAPRRVVPGPIGGNPPEREPDEDRTSYYSRLRRHVLARPTDPGAPDVARAAESVDRRLDRDARRLMASRGVTYRAALRFIAAGEAIQEGRQPTVPSEVEQIKAKLLGQKAKPAQLSTSERIQQYAELKQEALGKPAPVRLNREAARESVRHLGEQIKASEPAPVVVNDHADLVQAAEDYRAARWTGFGEKVTVKQAMLKVAKGRQ